VLAFFNASKILKKRLNSKKLFWKHQSAVGPSIFHYGCCLKTITNRIKRRQQQLEGKSIKFQFAAGKYLLSA
jgi:hypothetical protein